MEFDWDVGAHGIFHCLWTFVTWRVYWDSSRLVTSSSGTAFVVSWQLDSSFPLLSQSILTSCCLSCDCFQGSLKYNDDVLEADLVFDPCLFIPFLQPTPTQPTNDPHQVRGSSEAGRSLRSQPDNGVRARVEPTMMI